MTGALRRPRLATLAYLAITVLTNLLLPGIGVFREPSAARAVLGALGILAFVATQAAALYAVVTPWLSQPVRRRTAIGFGMACALSVPLVGPVGGGTWATWAWLGAAIIGTIPVLVGRWPAIVIALRAELAARLAPVDAERAGREAAEVQRLAASALGEVREAVHGYRTVDLGEQLTAIAQVLRSSGVCCTVTQPSEALPPDAAALLMPVMREASAQLPRRRGREARRHLPGRGLPDGPRPRVAVAKGRPMRAARTLTRTP